jgi:hypothetical protein
MTNLCDECGRLLPHIGKCNPSNRLNNDGRVLLQHTTLPGRSDPELPRLQKMAMAEFAATGRVSAEIISEIDRRSQGTRWKLARSR